MKLQFSTRTLLVLLTTLAVAIFFFVEPSYHRWRQESAHARLMKQLEPPAASGLWRFAADPFEYPLTELSLDGPGITGYDRESRTKVDLDEVSSFRDLEALGLFRIETDSLNAVGGLRQIRSLSIYACDILDLTAIENHASLKSVACDVVTLPNLPQIEDLQKLVIGALRSTYRVKIPLDLPSSVTVVDFEYDVNAAQLAKFPKLAELEVLQRSVSFTAMPRMESLAKLRLIGCYEVGGLEGLERASKLEELQLQTDELNKKQVGQLTKLKWLKRLHVNASEESLQRLRAALPHCTVN
jgi:hypothetical protein